MTNMKMEPQNLSARESLDIIAAMIQQAKGNARRNNFYFLLWGWVIVVANIGMYTLERLDYDRPYVVWLITIPAWIYTFYKVFTARRSEKIRTHFDRISGLLWMSFGITTFILVFFGYKINFQLNPVILIITAIPTIVSGIILNFRPLMVGSVIFWILGAICFLVPRETQPIVGALAIIFGYLIPGYMLKERKS